MKYLPLLAIVSAVALCLSLVRVTAIVVQGRDKGCTAVVVVREGDTVEIAHVNSIYDAPVTERLRVVGGGLRLEEVRTASAGVREYYGLDLPSRRDRRAWDKLQLQTSGLSVFEVKVNDRGLYRGTDFSIELKTLDLLRLALKKAGRLVSTGRCTAD